MSEVDARTAVVGRMEAALLDILDSTADPDTLFTVFFVFSVFVRLNDGHSHECAVEEVEKWMNATVDFGKEATA